MRENQSAAYSTVYFPEFAWSFVQMDKIGIELT